MHAYAHVHSRAAYLGDQRHGILLELKLQAVVSHPSQVLGTELPFSAVAAHALKLRAVSPDPFSDSTF